MKSTPDNIIEPQVGEPIRHSFLSALVERGRSVAFPRGMVAGGARAQSTEPKPYDFAKIRIKNGSAETLEAGCALQIDGVLNSGNDADDYLRLNVPPRRVFQGIVADMESPVFAIVQSSVPPGGICNAILSGYSIARIHLNSTEHEFAELRKGDTVLESCENGPVRIISRSEAGEGNTVSGFVRFEFGETGVFCKNLTDCFDTLNATDTANMLPISMDEEVDEIEVKSEIYGTEIPPFEFSWQLPAGALCYVKSQKVRTAQIPELSGRLNQSTTGGATESTEITLDEDLVFNGESTISAYPAPNIPDGTEVSEGTHVVIRWNHAVGKWFFFSHIGEGGKICHDVISKSGTALGGFGTHNERTVWATELSTSSESVNTVKITAVLKTVSAVASDDETPWLVFPTNSDGNIQYVRGEYYMGWNEIYKKEDYRKRYTPSLYDTGLYFNQNRLYKTASGTYVYYDGYGRWMQDNLGKIHSVDTNGNAIDGASNIEGLGYTVYQAPYWKEDSSNTYGIYKPQNGASGEFQFGRERWTFSDGTNTVYYQRSWKKDDSQKWYYVPCSGSGFYGWFPIVDGSTKYIKYVDCKSIGEGLILGQINNSSDGWYVLKYQNQFGTTSAITMNFQVVTQDDKDFTISEILGTWITRNGEIKKNTSEGIYYLRDTDVARWSMSNTYGETVFVWEHKLPEDFITEEELAGLTATEIEELENRKTEKRQDDKEITFENIVLREWSALALEKPQKVERTKADSETETETVWVIGVYEDENGWWELNDSEIQTQYTMEHGAVPRADITVTFMDYEGERGQEEIWYISPEIIT